ncbi:hypothetical protein [Pseudomonas iridis]|uniref:hypothetical protein n=1 Tax=Pseudomonas iridis TaxID=2710587 RepID=UPI001B324BB8|nr:hypothetical protein [Pseudomonas iridis]MBP5971029.1 hypothetical protein [Pseudomonas iridis]
MDEHDSEKGLRLARKALSLIDTAEPGEGLTGEEAAASLYGSAIGYLTCLYDFSLVTASQLQALSAEGRAKYAARLSRGFMDA